MKKTKLIGIFFLYFFVSGGLFYIFSESERLVSPFIFGSTVGILGTLIYYRQSSKKDIEK